MKSKNNGNRKTNAQAGVATRNVKYTQITVLLFGAVREEQARKTELQSDAVRPSHWIVLHPKS